VAARNAAEILSHLPTSLSAEKVYVIIEKADIKRKIISIEEIVN
jgi:hypothetical protein